MRLYVLDLGRMHMDRSLIVAKWRLASSSDPTPPAQFVEFPVPGFYIDHPDGGILFDTGCHPDCMGPDGRWPHEFQEHFPYSGGAENSVVAQLARIDVAPEQVRTIVLSHLHNDHSGGLEFFPNARVVVHADELSACLLAYARGDRDGPYIWDDTDHWVKLGLDFQPVERAAPDFELQTGVRVLNFGPGHAAGMLGLHLSLRGSGDLIIASDTIYCAENYGPPARAAGVLVDSVGYLATVERIRKLAKQTGAQVWFGHDGAQFRQLRKAPESYN
ncbi:MAG: N-acyl homoserine lactonase family protein [Rhizobiaceae bacterium]|nr:N-acyl homoserine lactonase family protein [Rhizobiaceae bacterium]